MTIENWSEDVVIVNLAPGTDVSGELERGIGIARKRGDCDVLVDLAEVEVLNSSHMASLLRLRTFLQTCGHRLILCNVNPLTKGVLSATGLETAFEIRDDRAEAMAAMQTCH